MTSFDKVDKYFCRVCDLPKSELDPASHFLVEVWHSFALIQNGGFHSYLCEIGETAHEIANHYEQSNIPKAANLISAATDLWSKYWPSKDPTESDPDDFRDRFERQLDLIEVQFYDLEDEIAERLAEIIPKFPPD